MSKERRKFSREFKIKVVQAYESGISDVVLRRIQHKSQDQQIGELAAFSNTSLCAVL